MATLIRLIDNVVETYKWIQNETDENNETIYFINGSLYLPGQKEHRTVHDDQWFITHCWDHYTNDFVFLFMHQSSGYFTFLWDWHRKYRFFQVMEKGLDNISSRYLHRILFVCFKDFFLQMWITCCTITTNMVIISTTTIPYCIMVMYQ